MKNFDVLAWEQVEVNASYNTDAGRIYLKTDQEAALWVSQYGVEVLHSVGRVFDLTVSVETEFRLVAPKGASAFWYNPASRSVETRGEVFTNTDRKPQESGTLLEVKKSLRQMALQHREFMNAARGERAAIERAKRDGRAERDEPPQTPERVDEKPDGQFEVNSPDEPEVPDAS